MGPSNEKLMGVRRGGQEGDQEGSPSRPIFFDFFRKIVSTEVFFRQIVRFLPPPLEKSLRTPMAIVLGGLSWAHSYKTFRRLFRCLSQSN